MGQPLDRFRKRYHRIALIGCGYLKVTRNQYLSAVPGVVFDAATHLLCPGEKIRGFSVIDPMSEDRTTFVIAVDEALGLIAKFSPSRFNRVRLQIRRIINAPARFGSSYLLARRACSLNFECFREGNDPNLTGKYLAAALIEQAAYGHLMSQGIPRTRSNHERYDNVCFEEARRFLKRVGLDKNPWDAENIGEMKMHFWKEALKIISQPDNGG
jgi:hypothetical protein